MTTADYFRALLDAGRDQDARRLLAFALPKRRALWWGCLCAWDGLRGKASPQELAALECVTDFIHSPGEERRRAAQKSREGLRPSSPAGTLAAAAFLSAGSISVPGAITPIPAPDHLTGQLVSVAVYLSAAIREPARYKLHQRHYLALGEEIALGRNLWRDAAIQPDLRLDAVHDPLLTAPHFHHSRRSAAAKHAPVRVGKRMRTRSEENATIHKGCCHE
jgi:hypothetical protein